MSDTKITWQRRVASWRASGQTADEFAAAQGLTASTLRWWASQLKREAATTPTTTSTNITSDQGTVVEKWPRDGARRDDVRAPKRVKARVISSSLRS